MEPPTMRRIIASFGVIYLTWNLTLSAEDWPQWRGPNRDGVWLEQGIVDRFPADGLKILWRAPLGAGYSGPVVSAGRVFVTDRVAEPEQLERIHCFDSGSGEAIWSYTYPCPYDGISYTAGPRAAVTIDQQRAYALGATGWLHCLEAASGQLLWRANLDEQFQIRGPDAESNRMPIWGIAAAPLVYDDLLILHIGGRQGACVVALDKLTGRERWRALDDRAQYSSPIVVQQAGHDVLVVWTGDNVVGLDPRSGRVHWRSPLPPSRMPIGVATPISSGSRLFVTSFYDGSLMLRLDPDRLEVEPLWRAVGPDEQHTEGLHSIISTPIFLGDYLYGVDSYGELRCLEAATGKRLWEEDRATPRGRWSTIHFVRHEGQVWLFNEKGELIIAELSPAGYHEISRAQLISPTLEQLRQRGGVCWSHPAFAQRCVFARNDNELVCAELASPAAASVGVTK